MFFATAGRYLTRVTATVEHICSKFSSHSKDSAQISPYYPPLEPIYRHFISVLYDSCDPFIKDPQEIQYIASARWPGFIKPVLDDYQRSIEAAQINEPPPTFDLPSEEFRMRLVRTFLPSLKSAMEDLHPRTTSATDWCNANQPSLDVAEKMFQVPGSLSPSRRVRDEVEDVANDTRGKSKARDGGIEALPRQSRFILLASYLASNNPAKTDLRMFGRGLDEKKRKRKTNRSKTQPKVNTGFVKV